LNVRVCYPRPAAGLAAWGLALALGPACSEPSTPETEAPIAQPAADEAQPMAGGVLARDDLLGGFLAAHWKLPIAPQGEIPAGWSALEASLAPRDCGSCHPQQLEQWRTSLHAGAYSPGFSGQLIEGGLAQPGEVRQCQTCHAPLAEQQPHTASGAPNPGYDHALREQGIVCAACHVRGHQRFGPPRRPELPPLATPLPHGGFEARAEFSESRFCAECHQFFDDPGIAGKPIQNTYAEWRESPAAAEGRSCQSCHMPDRAHLWRGIHDPEMVRSAVEVTLRVGEPNPAGLHAELHVHSHGVGHAFPSYVTPRVFLAVWQEDAGGREIVGTRVEDVVGREIDFGAWQEVFDTRIPAGGTRTLVYSERRRRDAAAVVGQVRVDPDYHYRGVFASLVDAFADPVARSRIEEAHRRSIESVFVLRELRHALARSDEAPMEGDVP